MPPPFRSVVFPNYDLTQGTKSSHAAAVATLQTRRTDGVLRSFQARRRAGCTQSQILNHTCPPAVPSDKLPVVTIDTHAEAAWRQGWTGKGVEVAIVDSSGSHADHTYTVTASVAPEADINLLRTNLRIGLSQQLLGGALQTLDSNAKRQYDTLDECRPQAAGLLKLRETEKDAGDRVIFVGSLADGANTIADYSYTAGKLQNDFIVAHDDVWSAGDTGGTSFAAPRVTGAAALVRHKFPNLNGPQLKQVLLQSADDLGTPGPDAVFGYGKLNIMSALSPIDGLTK